MKNLILAMIALVAFSCQNDENAVPNVAPTATAKNHSYRQTSLRIYIDNGDRFYGCAGAGGNCLEDVIIINELTSNFPDINSFIEKLNQIPNNQFFTENSDLLSIIMKEDLKASVISGKNIATGKVQNAEKTAFILFKNASTGELVQVLPIK